MPIPDLPLFRHRDTVVTPADQNQFVTQFETTMDTMSNDVIPALNLAITDINAKTITTTTARDEAVSAKNIAVSAKDEALTAIATLTAGAIDDTTIATNKAFSNQKTNQLLDLKLNKDFSSFIDKPTPSDTDNLALQETGGLLKKLSFANLKLWILSLFNPSITGTVSFNSTTNNIELTNIVTALGLEIGDVIRISGAEDAKNNSEFTVEVITDNNNIIVNQAHANKGTRKNVANRSGDADVTVKRLAKWYNANDSLGRDWINVTSSRAKDTTYNNNTNRPIPIAVSTNILTNSYLSILVNNNVIIIDRNSDSGSSGSSCSSVIPRLQNYKVGLTSASGGIVEIWQELR